LSLSAEIQHRLLPSHLQAGSFTPRIEVRLEEFIARCHADADRRLSVVDEDVAAPGEAPDDGARPS
jgi:hypothetical protein